MYLKKYFTKSIIYYCLFEMARMFGRHVSLIPRFQRKFLRSCHYVILWLLLLPFYFYLLCFFLIYLLIDWKEISIRYVCCALLFVFQIATQSVHVFSNYFTQSKSCVIYGIDCIREYNWSVLNYNWQPRKIKYKLLK